VCRGCHHTGVHQIVVCELTPCVFVWAGDSGSSDGDSGMSGGAIAGAVCGPLFGLLGLGGYLYSKRNQAPAGEKYVTATKSDFGGVSDVSSAADVKVDVSAA